MRSVQRSRERSAMTRLVHPRRVRRRRQEVDDKGDNCQDGRRIQPQLHVDIHRSKPQRRPTGPVLRRLVQGGDDLVQQPVG
jgi:hypothetical protein